MARPAVVRSVLALSFVPLLVKAIDYARLGGFVPLLVLVVFGAWVVLGLRRGPAAARWAAAGWASALVLWGVVRLGLYVLLTWAPIGEAHVEGQLTIAYVLVSLANAAIGAYLFRFRDRLLSRTGQHILAGGP